MPKGHVDWDRLNSMTQEEIEKNALSDPDALPPTDEMWALAYSTTLPSAGKHKDQMTLRLDPEVVAYFRGTGKGFQSRMNAVLRHYVEGQKQQNS